MDSLSDTLVRWCSLNYLMAGLLHALDNRAKTAHDGRVGRDNMVCPVNAQLERLLVVCSSTRGRPR